MAMRISFAGANTGAGTRGRVRKWGWCWECGDSLGVKLRGRTMGNLGRRVGVGIGMSIQRRGLLTDSYSVGPTEVMD